MGPEGAVNIIFRRELADAGDVAGTDVKVVLTGGLANAPFAAAIDGVDAVDPHLTLKGLAILHAEVAGGTPLEFHLS
jgi:pantothenate kinase type III